MIRQNFLDMSGCSGNRGFVTRVLSVSVQHVERSWQHHLLRAWRRSRWSGYGTSCPGASFFQTFLHCFVCWFSCLQKLAEVWFQIRWICWIPEESVTFDLWRDGTGKFLLRDVWDEKQPYTSGRPRWLVAVQLISSAPSMLAHQLRPLHVSML